MRLLLVDDEVGFVMALKELLSEQHFLVDTAFDGDTGFELANFGSYDLLIFDVMLPGMSGYDLVRAIRKDGDSTPILLLTAKDAVDDRVEGLDSGADDYLVKPFATKELLARIRALTRRSGEVIAMDSLTVGDLNLDLVSRTATRGKHQVKLTGKEFQLLELFMRNPNRVLPKVVIFDRVWGYDSALDVSVVEIYVHMLRKKMAELTDDACTYPNIETIRGVGYVLKGD